MTKENLDKIVANLPEKVRIGTMTWYKEPLKLMPWWRMPNPGTYTPLPLDAVEDMHLVSKYDNAFWRNKGCTPSEEDFNQLFAECECVPVDGDDGVLLRDNNGNYFYLPAGEFWTSTAQQNDVGEYLPLSLCIDNGKHQIRQNYEPHSAQLMIISIKKEA